MYWEIHSARTVKFPDGRDFAPSGPRDRPTVIPISLTSRANYKCNYSSLPITSFVTLWLTSKLLKQIQHSKTTIDYDFVLAWTYLLLDSTTKGDKLSSINDKGLKDQHSANHCVTYIVSKRQIQSLPPTSGRQLLSQMFEFFSIWKGGRKWKPNLLNPTLKL